jgi:hypothetical protein
VTEHRAHDCECTACGAKTRALFPDSVNAPVQYGARITALVIYLLHYQLLPENRLAILMVDLFGVKVATATIARMSRACAERLHGFVETVRDLGAGAPAKHMDETGFRIGGKTQWLHVASTALLTFYRVCAKRGSLLANVVGIVVDDHSRSLGAILHDRRWPRSDIINLVSILTNLQVGASGLFPGLLDTIQRHRNVFVLHVGIAHRRPDVRVVERAHDRFQVAGIAQ